MSEQPIHSNNMNVTLRGTEDPSFHKGHARKVMLSTFKHYVKQELPDVQARSRNSRGTRDETANSCWIIEKANEFQKKTQLLFH